MSSVDYIPIRISTLRGDLATPFDVFVKIADRFILYCRSGSTFEGARLERLKSKKLKAMYVRQADEIPYRQYLEASIDNAYNNKGGKNILTRTEVIQGFQQAAIEQFFEAPTDEIAYSHVQSSAERFVGFLQSEPEALKTLLTIPNTDQSITHHGVSVASLSVAIAKANNIRNDKLITTMTLGAFLHDIDHFHTGINLTDTNSETYKGHPIAGANRLQKSKFVDQMVFNIISQHEEHANGSGFPRGLKEKEMDPLVISVAIANAYERMLSFEGADPKVALKNLLINKVGAYPLPLFQTLQGVLKTAQVV